MIRFIVPMPPQVYLFVPGHRPDRFAKAVSSGADCVILDLEDAVPTHARPEAREAIRAWLPTAPPVAVRLNAPGTEWFGDDLACCGHAAVAAVFVPKAERVEALDEIARGLPPTTSIVPMIETAAGFARCLDLARHPRVGRLAFGSLDFQADLGIPGDDDALLYFRSQLVLTSRLAGIAAPIDGITPRFDAPEPVIADAARARRLGFGGKLCIHPKQIPWIRTCLSPSPEEVEWATRVVAATRQGDGAIAVDGVMVDRPVLDRANAILAGLGHGRR
jgi:citrate lyase subunit beta/citryl-CoA lyase